MALDWSKEITFTGMKKKSGTKNAALPEKTTMNLLPRKTREVNPLKLIIGCLIGIIVLALFIKFGVVDFYGRVDSKKSELATQSQILSDAQAEISRYDEVEEKYEEYGFFNMNDSNASVDILDAIDLVDRKVAPVARVISFDMKNNVMTLELMNISLDDAGKLTATLYDEDLVESVAVSTAASQDNPNEVIVTMKVGLSIDSKK